MLNQFSRTELLLGKEAMERLSRARVAVFGIGGVGGYTVEALARSGRQLDVALESHQLVTVGRMVASGLGGSAVPALCKTQMASLGAVCIPLSDPPIEKCVGAIHAGHLPLSKAAQALLDTLKGFLPT